ncbi:hypothetical protein [Methylicorpusculum sp.]|uniref:hypothetical protein n=1 Tax=Methylicorpusculum sp. TaxID=2713644 RepID=UPI00272EEA66|nr:hypothetical protein [Methylicorpusculum sp.]MDP2178614.1 hypothetical protein [Methylicorpusculum sp.]MDP3531597.1 hypothetical protein [Methylicorpusculum sp.]
MDQTTREPEEIVLLSQQLAALLENREQMQQQEKPYLVALYQANLGELEYRLLGLQIECRALQERIERATRTLNHGEALTQSRRIQPINATPSKLSVSSPAILQNTSQGVL